MEQHYYEGYFSNTRLIWGVIIILIGGVLLLHTLDAINVGRLVKDFWPLIFVITGLYLLLKRPHYRRISSDIIGDKSMVCESDEAFYSNIFGEVELKITSPNFQTGRIHNVFGEMEIDLEDLTIASGEKVLHLSGVFGDIKVAVPKKVPFFIKANLLAGDIKILGQKRSGFSIDHTYKSEGYDTAENRLTILISHVFGDIKVR